MTVTIAPPPTDAHREPAPNRIYITRAMCKTLTDSGLLTGRYELIDGEVISKMGQNRPHANAVMLFTRLLMRWFGEEFVQCQLPIDVGDAAPDINNPEPDIVALARPVNAFTTADPGADDILLLIEVSDTTLRFDLHAKASLYARAGIAEYWAADVVGQRIFAHRNPTPTGYSEIVEYGADAMFACLARPDSSVRVSDLLPPVLSEAG